MAFSITYVDRARRGSSSNEVVTERTRRNLAFDEQGRLKFYNTEGKTRRLDTVYVIRVEPAPSGNTGGSSGVSL